MAAEISTPEPDRVVECPIDVSTLESVRDTVTRFGREHGVAGDVLDDFVLATHELATNVVQHGGGRGSLRLWHDGQLVWGQIRDAGPGMPPVPEQAGPPTATSLNGRGLWLVRRTTGTVIVESDGRGTAVTISARA